MLKVIDFICCFLVCVFIVFAILFCYDREEARKQYAAGDRATECIFQANCDHYNAKRLEEF